jgi:hypothetical protein
VTAFRVVELLVRLGIVDRLTFPDGAIRSHMGKGPTRQYLTCEQCHTVVELHLGFVPPLLDTIVQMSGFVRSNVPVEITGRCPDCQNNEGGPGAVLLPGVKCCSPFVPGSPAGATLFLLLPFSTSPATRLPKRDLVSRLSARDFSY